MRFILMIGVGVASTVCAPHGLADLEAAATVAVDTTADSNTITRKVHEIAAPGVPGPVVLFGADAFPIVVGTESKGIVMPVVAGSRLGNGRVVAFGHGGYLEVAAMKTLDTGKLVENAIRWAAANKTPRIGAMGETAFVQSLSDRHLDARELKSGWEKEVTGLDVLVVQTHQLSAAQQEAVVRFVKNGGGLLAGGLGWGWLQLNPGRGIREHPGNLLLREAGIAWGDGTLDRTVKGGYAAGGAPPRGLNGMEAMEIIERAASDGAEKDDKAVIAQAAATVGAAVQVVPERHGLVGRCRELLKTREAMVAPTKEKPLRTSDGVARALMAVQTDLEKQAATSEVRAHITAATFPGEVAKDAARVEREIVFERGKAGWQSTGLYAPAGEIISIIEPSEVAKNGIKIRIGCHTDHLWKLNSWQRAPDISRVFALNEGRNQFASAFGGLVYVEASEKKAGPPFTLKIQGSVESPRFVLGKTTAAEWKSSREAPAPWGELETSKVIISVPSSHLRTLEDPESLMQFWDKIADAHATLGARPLERRRPERYVADVQISAGYMHSGYPIMTHLDAAEAMTSIDKLKAGSWGLLHELGHNHQEGDWTFEGTTEVTCNLFALHAIDTICTPPAASRGHGGVDKPPSLAKYVEGGAKFEQWKKDPFLALHMYVQLQREFGWETFKRVFAEYRALPKTERPKNDDEKRDQWMVRFSRACGRNLGPFFVAWGVPTSESARKSIAELQEWMPGDWQGE